MNILKPYMQLQFNEMFYNSLEKSKQSSDVKLKDCYVDCARFHMILRDLKNGNVATYFEKNNYYN